MTLIEAAKQAREALERMKGYGDVFLYRRHEQKPYDQVCNALAALDQAIAEAEQQEPVAWDWISLNSAAQKIVRSKAVWRRFIDGTPLANDIACWMADFALEHTAAPKREWQGLTDGEWVNILNKNNAWHGYSPDRVAHEVCALTEAKLKEKNT